MNAFMNIIFEIIILIYLVTITYFTVITVIMISKNTDLGFVVPDMKFIYQNTELNVLGVFLLTIIIFICNPIVSIIWILYKFIFFIIHVGRK